MKSPVRARMSLAERFLRQRTNSSLELVGHSINVPSFLVFSFDALVCVQQSKAVPLSDIPPVRVEESMYSKECIRGPFGKIHGEINARWNSPRLIGER